MTPAPTVDRAVLERSVLSAFPPEDRGPILRELPRRKLRAGALLFQEGEAPRTAHLLLSGFLKAVKFSAGDRIAAMDLIRPGRLCGAIALLDRRPYPVSVYALGPAEAATIPAALFDRWMATPAFARAVHAEVGDHLRHAQSMRALAAEPVEKRLAHLLLLLQPDGAPDVRLRREDLAELAGCIPETVIRALSDMKKRGLVRTGWKRVAVLDRDGLRRIAESPNLS